MKKLANILLIFLFILACKNNSPGQNKQQDSLQTSDPLLMQRLRMVETQIAQRGVKDSLVLRAMKKVPRHKFVPEFLKDFSYSDRPLSIGEDQTISQPYIVALMTETLKLGGDEKVLEIGTGSGYQAAVLAEIVSEVYTIEIIPSLGKRAKKLLDELGYKNVHAKIGDGYQGWPTAAPFDGIIVTAAPDHIPQPLIDQLKNGGRMIIPVGDFYQELILLTKNKKGKIKKKSVLPVIFVPMTGDAEKKKK